LGDIDWKADNVTDAVRGKGRQAEPDGLGEETTLRRAEIGDTGENLGWRERLNALIEGREGTRGSSDLLFHWGRGAAEEMM
jgi:hypothetical protein